MSARATMSSPLTVSLLLVAAGVLAATTATRTAARTWQDRPSSCEEVTAGGYSIFDETMVDMTWVEIEEAAKEDAIVLLPTGVVEEHGPHMACGIDTYGAYLLAKLIRRELEDRGIPTLIAPPFYWGINRTTHVFPGTFTVRPDTMKALIHDLLSSLKSWGFDRVINVNGHRDGAHISVLLQALIEARETLEVETWFLLDRAEAARYRFTGDEPFLLLHDSAPFDVTSRAPIDLHAGAIETSFAATWLPSLVDINLARTLAPTELTIDKVGQWVTDARQTTPQGYLGDPANFTLEGAEDYARLTSAMMADAIEELVNRN